MSVSFDWIDPESAEIVEGTDAGVDEFSARGSQVRERMRGSVCATPSWKNAVAAFIDRSVGYSILTSSSLDFPGAIPLSLPKIPSGSRFASLRRSIT